jgi:L-methionine (R)-S-oxide reductase
MSESGPRPVTMTGGSKEDEYKLCLKGLRKFFEKYPSLDTAGKMATIKCVAVGSPASRARAPSPSLPPSPPNPRPHPSSLFPPTSLLRSSYLKSHFPRMWFVGFYTVSEPETSLQIGPYQGQVFACGAIAWGKGVCGTAAQTGTTQIVDDVSKCDNYIACDEDTKSEIVVPVFSSAPCYIGVAAGATSPGSWAAGGGERRLIAVLDIDADIVAAFDATDKQFLEEMMGEFF